jgi:hypothetical protein
MTTPDTKSRRAFLKALAARVEGRAADQRTTVMDFVGRDVGMDPEETEAMVQLLHQAGLVTAPTKDRVIGLTNHGMVVAQREEMEADEDDA